MFPSKVDLTKDECRGALRRLELEAYSSVVSTFRAQGNLDSNKQIVLEQLRRFFQISDDRHKAEIRRVANNEKLTTISELINGKSYDLEWIKEGHRSYPLISRATSCTALHILADHASKVAAIDNTDLLLPSETRREKSLDKEIMGRQIIIDDPTKPPQLTSSSASFGISRKDLKRSIDLVTLHSHTKKKHYHLKPPPSAPHMKIQHLYQTMNTKRPRKSFTKKSKTKVSSTKQSLTIPSGRMQFSYAVSSPEDKNFDGAELQKHLTSQLMPPPPMKLLAYSHKLPTTKETHLEAYAQSLPTSRKEMNLLKMNPHHHHQQQQSLEPLAHYIPNNRLKSELLSEQHQQSNATPTRARPSRSKSISVLSKSNYNTKYANGAGPRFNSNMDHIPDPQIIFNTTSTKVESSSLVDSIPLESSDMDMSPVITSPLQLLSTAASCTPKLKINSPTNHHLSSSLSSLPSPSLQSHLNLQIQQQSTNVTAQLPSSASSSLSSSTITPSISVTSPINTLKTVQNRAIKIIPANTKPMIIKPQNSESNKSPQQQQQTSISTPSKFKIQKIQLVMNKSQDGSSTNISPTATIVSGKAGQLVLSGKGISNTYHVGGKAPCTVLSNNATKISGSGGPKVIVQTIDRSFAQAQKDKASSIDAPCNIGEKLTDNQRITENTPIDFLPLNTNSTATGNSFPKVIIQKTSIAPKQIKLKLGPGSIVNSKIIKGQLPGNLKIQRNINTKGFTVLNTSQIFQIQANTGTSTNSTSPINPSIILNNNESTKTDWEQELDDANRTKENSNKDTTLGENNGNLSSTKSISSSGGSGGSLAKKPRLDELQVKTKHEEVVQKINDNMIIETSENESNSNNDLIYAENLPQIDAKSKEHSQYHMTVTTPEPISEFVYVSEENDSKKISSDINNSSDNDPVQELIINGEDESTKLNGQFEKIMQIEQHEERPHNGAEAYENLVKSLEAECENDYMKEITGEEDSQIDENFRLINNSNMLDPSITFSRETEGIFQ